MTTRFRAAAALAVVALGGAAQADGPPVKIGMIQGMFRDTQPAMVQALSRPLRNLIQQQTGLSGTVEIVPDACTLADKMKAGDFQLGVYHGFEFAWVQKTHPDLVPLVVTVPPARTLRAMVVIQADSPAKKLSDLADAVVLVPRGTKAHCFLYLDAQRVGLPAASARPQTKPALTSEEALDAVVQGDHPAAVVDASALLGYQSLQPGAARQLRVLCESDAFPASVIAYQKGSLPAGTIDGVRKLLTEAHQTPAGKPLMMLWNLKGFEDVPADYGDQLTRIGKAYPTPVPSAFPGATAQTGK